MPIPPASGWPYLSLLELAALPTAVPCGRLHTRQVLWEWKLGYLADDGELLASELLSNAVNAATASPGAGVVALRLLAYEQRLRVEVWDHSPGHPVSRTLDGTTEGGRGCTVIAAIAGTWGCQRIHPKLKVVWAELLIPGECR